MSVQLKVPSVGESVTLSAYEDYCDVFESVAETFDPHADRQSRSA